MKLIPVNPLRKSVGGNVSGVKWRYDPELHGDGMEVSPEVGRALVKTGHWTEVQPEPKKAPFIENPYITIDDVFKEVSFRITNAFFDGRDEVMQVLIKTDLVDLAERTYREQSYPPTEFALKAIEVCTAAQLKIIYGTPLEDFGVKRFKDTLRQGNTDDGIQS